VDECKPLANGYVTAAHVLGRAVQVDPIKPVLKAPGTKLSKLKYDQLLSSFAFKFNLRRYSWACRVCCVGRREFTPVLKAPGCSTRN